MEADGADWSSGVDPTKASVARIYDYFLGGTHNFSTDRDVARTLEAIEPRARLITRANRAFLARATRFLAAEAGVRQFIDIGSGIPTQGNVHEIVQGVDPAARVVYVDHDPVAVAHSTAILAGNQNATVVQADLRDAHEILEHSTVQRMIDFSRPVGLLLVAVLHFIADEDRPASIVARLRDGLAPGSHLVLSHGTHQNHAETTEAVSKVYRRAVTQANAQARSREEILGFFDGFELVEPGLVQGPLWRPDTPADVPEDVERYWFLGGVGRR
ncbi:SAM-dependent methyltransferase [Actinomadura sp. HBU206391]|uniref:SAM-dependent methyltransferase n=1 Tax=Actinomadura sp. HBU206391 TaxID=2731692 RepID=UPI002905D748|nr:SAM-dependent methyltransferase [Actinomadura sp. HBU206391]